MNLAEATDNQANLLLEAFSSFTEASSSLERAYCELLEKVEILSGELERSNYYLSTVLQSLPCGVLVISQEKQVITLNRVAADLVGLHVRLSALYTLQLAVFRPQKLAGKFAGNVVVDRSDVTGKYRPVWRGRSW